MKNELWLPISYKMRSFFIRFDFIFQNLIIILINVSLFFSCLFHIRRPVYVGRIIIHKLIFFFQVQYRFKRDCFVPKIRRWMIHRYGQHQNVPRTSGIRSKGNLISFCGFRFGKLPFYRKKIKLKRLRMYRLAGCRVSKLRDSDIFLTLVFIADP